MIVEAFKNRPVNIGRLGENEARTVKLPVSDLEQEFPGCLFVVLHRRKGDPSAYPVPSDNFTVEDGFLYWTVTSGDVAKEGNGECQVSAVLNAKVMKTDIYMTIVGRALDGAGTPPDPWASWQQQVAVDAASAEASALKSEGYAVGEQNGEPVTEGEYYENNAKYYCEQAEEAVGSLIDDTAGAGVLNKAWSADKLTTDFANKADKNNPVFTGGISLGRKANTTIGANGLAVGNNVEASGARGVALGSQTKASGTNTFASGSTTTASGGQSFATGKETYATGQNAFTGGYGTVANHLSQYAFGEYNVMDPSTANGSQRGNYIEVIGNGNGAFERSNARTLDWDGNEHLKGDLYVGCNADSTGGSKVIASSEKGVANGIATLDGTGKVPSSQLPSYVDDIEEYASRSAFPAPGETGKLYVTLDTDKVYRWSGTTYIEISDPTIIIDDTAGDGVTDKVWSANKVYDQFALKAPKADPIFTGSISLGRKTSTVVGSNSAAIGSNTTASGENSFAEGKSTVASGKASHSEGNNTSASGEYSHAGGYYTTASGKRANATGYGTTASGNDSNAEGYTSSATGIASHAEGAYSTASGESSHAEGCETIANHKSQHVAGEYNVADGSSATASNRGNYVEIIGNGTADNARSNSRVLDWDGNERLKGDLYVGCNADSTGGSKVLSASEKGVANGVASLDAETKIPVSQIPETIYRNSTQVSANSTSSVAYRGFHASALVGTGSPTFTDNVRLIGWNATNSRYLKELSIEIGEHGDIDGTYQILPNAPAGTIEFYFAETKSVS